VRLPHRLGAHLGRADAAHPAWTDPQPGGERSRLRRAQGLL